MTLATPHNIVINSERTKLDIDFVHSELAQKYWSLGIPRAVVEAAIANSLCFGVYLEETQKQIGFARVITDGAVFGYIADVFIIEQFRGNGLSKWMMKVILDHPALQGFRRWMLGTKDAHGLYAQFGFAPLDNPEIYMILRLFNEYPAIKNEEDKL